MSRKCNVVYLLDEEGRKKSLLAGGDGKTVQVIEADITKEILDLATVDDDGNAFVTIGFNNYSYKELKKRLFSETICGEVVRPKLIEGFGGYMRDQKPHIKDIYEIKFFSDIQTLEELLEYDKKRKDEYKKLYNKLSQELKVKLEEYELERSIELEHIKKFQEEMFKNMNFLK